MSDAQRKEAIDDMSPTEFDALIENLPPEEHERLGPLVNATTDPTRKLEMWSRAEKAELGRDGRNLDNVDVDDETDAKLLERAVKATEGGKAEIDDEVTNAMRQLEDPTLSDQAKKALVDDLIARKEKERAIEKQFNVDLTNDKGGESADGLPTPRVTWTQPQLEQMEVVLDRLPDEAIQENPDLVEIRRAQEDYDMDDDGNWVLDPNTNGSHSNGRITIYDDAMTSTNRHSGDSSDIAGIHGLARFQHTLAHEVGHIMDKKDRDAADAVRAQADWKPAGADAVARLAQTEASGVATDGRVYVENADGSVSSFDPALVPEGGAHTDEDNTKDTWSYARSKPSDYFAEMYAKSVTTPELLHKDLVSGPEAHVKELQDNGAPQADIDEAKRVAKAKADQHAAMRKNVFHVDDNAVAAREAAIDARADELGLDLDAKKQLVADYRAQAQQAMTLEQLDAVKNTFDDLAYDY